LIKAGTLLNIWLYFHHGTRVLEYCVTFWTGMAGSGYTMGTCVHRMLYCSAVQSSVDSFALRTLA
jgi:hypothetical protein